MPHINAYVKEIVYTAFKVKTKQIKRRKIMIKTILVVEDTVENMEVAKQYFSGIEGYEFIFASNRSEADELLDQCDALITDRSIPYKVEEKEDEANGFYLLLKASLLGKKSLMVTSHGNSYGQGVATIDDDSREVVAAMIAKIGKLQVYNPNYTFLSDFRNSYYKDWASINWFGMGQGPSKTDSRAWRYAWEELQKQF